MRREAQASLLGVAYPALVVPLVRQITGAQPLLELPEVAPQLEVLTRRNIKLKHTHQENIRGDREQVLDLYNPARV